MQDLLKVNWQRNYVCQGRQLQNGKQEFPKVKDITLQPTLTICLKIIWNTNRHCLHFL